MRVTSKFAKTEHERQDSSVRRSGKRGRMTQVIRILGPIRIHPSDLMKARAIRRTKRLIGSQNESTVRLHGSPLGECRVREV
jgi:hypothetical protein